MARAVGGLRRWLSFLRQYTADDVIASIRRLIHNVLEGIGKSSNAFVKILLSIALIPLIALLAVVLLFKNFFRYIIRFFLNIFRLLKTWIVITIEEINFYVERLAKCSRSLKKGWSSIFDLSLKVVYYLATKIINDNATFQSPQESNILVLTWKALKATAVWLVWLFITIFMGAVLSLTSVLFGPVLHRFLREHIK